MISQFGSASVACDGVAIGKVAVSDNFAAVYNALTTTPLTPFQAWQNYYFGSTNSPAADPAADPDGDGQNNWAEFVAGTDPTNSASVFRITAIATEAGGVRVTWMTGVGRTNALQGSISSISGGFTDLFYVTNTTGLPTNYLDVGALTSASTRYYRVRIAP